MSGLIELTGVTKIYGSGDAEVRALDGVDLTIDEGELVAVMGQSGSGKSTCMNILGCLDAPTGGTYLFRKVDVGSLDKKQLALLRRYYIGFVFQGFNLLARTSAIENVELPLVYRRVGAEDRRQRAQRALEMVGLSGRENHKPNQLSGGQQQRVAIARALATDPSILLADEPTGNLDSARKTEIMELLVRLNKDRGITVIVITHEPDMATYCDRVVEFRDGRIVSDKTNPGKMNSDGVNWDRVASDKVNSDETGSDWTASDKAASDKAASDKTASDKTASDKTNRTGSP